MKARRGVPPTPPTTAPDRVEIRLFGGFQASRPGQPPLRFESQRVRALFAYLVCHPGQAFSRESLAGLLWPEEPSDAARRNLRQALYNLRSTLGESDNGAGFLATEGHGVRFEATAAYWLDVAAFESALEAAATDPGGSLQALSRAVSLYRGDFLAGLFVDEARAFEEWLLVEQERLREVALEALRELVERHLATGRYALGIRYARQLLKLDPLAEPAHRDIMRLYALSGRRSRAMAQYEELVRLLAEDLDVEPLAETTALYDRISDQKAPDPHSPVEEDPVRPLVPLVGRDEALARLGGAFREVRKGSVRLTWIEGSEGMGKSRLAKTALHELASEDRAMILQGRFFDLAPPQPLRGFREAFDDILAFEPDAAETLLTHLPDKVLAHLALLAPHLCELRPELPRPATAVREPLFDATARALAALARSTPDGQPLILFLDDLHWADRSSLDLLGYLCETLERCPLWILVASQPIAEGSAGAHVRNRIVELPCAEIVTLGGLDEEHFTAIAEALVGSDQTAMLARFLRLQSGSSPAIASELINLLWDLGTLQPSDEGSWRLLDSLDEAAAFPAADLSELVEMWVIRLPPSIRRLAALAAVVGPRFDAQLLCDVEGEDPTVVDAGLRVLLDRWALRLYLGYWADSRRERDLTLLRGSSGAFTFEFSQEAVRRSVYTFLSPDRRAAVHCKVATRHIYRARLLGDEIPAAEVAYHFAAGGAWSSAVPYLLQAADEARRLGAEDLERVYLERAREGTTILIAEGGEFADRWQADSATIDERLGNLEEDGEPEGERPTKAARGPGRQRSRR